MASKEEVLRQQCEALEVYYEKLSRDFYRKFQLKQLDETLPASPLNTVIVTKQGEKVLMQQLFIEVKAIMASALDAYMSYKRGWFSDEKVAEQAKQMIEKLSREYDKTKYFFESYRIIEE